METFCERAEAALAIHGAQWSADRAPTTSAFLSFSTLPAFARALIGVARHARPDLLWLQYVALPDLAYILIARLRGIPVLVTPHLGANWRSQQSPGLRAVAQMFLRQATRIALLSQSQEQELTLPATVPKSRIATFLPEAALGESREPPTTDEHRPLRLIHSARLSEGKGSFLFLDLLAGLRERGIPFEASLIGRADAATQVALDAHIAAHGLRDVVSITPWMEETALLGALREADILVHLSRIDSYPLIVLEALASGTFPIVLDLPGAREIVTRYGGMVIADERPVDAVLEELTGLDRQSMRQQGSEAATRLRIDLGWNSAVAQLEAAFEDSCAGQLSATSS